MKKILITILLILSSITSLSWNPVFAAPDTAGWDSRVTTVITTEKVPWIDCKEEKGWTVEERKYRCTVKPWFESFMDVLKWLVKYFLFIAVLVIVLMLAVSWIHMSIVWKNESAKKQFRHLIEAILVIFLMGFILNTIAPWVYY